MSLEETNIGERCQVESRSKPAIAELRMAMLEVLAHARPKAFYRLHRTACMTTTVSTPETAHKLPERALARAEELDNYLAKQKRVQGPLHDLPISVKEYVGMRGLDLNTGFVTSIGTKAEDDALILKILWKAECVFYVRTTEPQTLVYLAAATLICCTHSLSANCLITPLTIYSLLKFQQ